MGDIITVLIEATPGEHLITGDDCLFHVGRDMSVTMEFILGEGQKLSVVLSSEEATLFSASLSPEHRKRVWEGPQNPFHKRRH